jgi:N-acetylmuramoyl-L-alanine amidase
MTPKPTYEFLPSPNFTKGRKHPISAIVIHYTDSLNIEGPLSWFRTKASAVSAHYLVGRDGRVVQMVHDGDIAWHAGRSAMAPHATPPGETNVNAFSLGIELVGTGDSGFTDVQMASLYSLLELLISTYHIHADRVVGHSRIAPGRKLDPEGYHGQFNWAKTRAIAVQASLTA